MVQIGQEIEVKVLRVDLERERIALGLKQKQASPWDGIEARYPVHSRHVGEVVNIMSYGAFVKLEDGVEGLVHISEMSWTKRINHPSELVKPGDKVEVIVLEIDLEKQEISLGMKQAETNPWDLVESHYPPGTIIEGTVRNLTTYGAFVEIEEGIDGLLHVVRHELDEEGHASERSRAQGRSPALRGAVGRHGQEAHRARPEAALQRPVAGDDPVQLPRRATCSRATSRRSPTSVCS
jgi:ribosomal protein S1